MLGDMYWYNVTDHIKFSLDGTVEEINFVPIFCDHNPK